MKTKNFNPRHAISRHLELLAARSRSIRKVPEADILSGKIDSLFQTTNVG
jgi:hypothetical protein